MYQILNRNKKRTINFILFTLVTICLLLLMVVFKNDEKIIKNKKNISFQHPDIVLIKKFLLTKIKSPFTNINYEIKSGDSIQRILQKFEIHNNEIQTIINQYKKYSNPNKLLKGNKIDIIIKKKFTQKR